MSRKRSLEDALRPALAEPARPNPRSKRMRRRIVLAIILPITVTAASLAVFTGASAVDDPGSFVLIQPADVDPDCKTDDECRAKCASHHTPACKELARRRVGMNFPDFEKEACDLGAGHQCVQYAYHLEYSGSASEANREEVGSYQTRGRELEQVHCDGGDASSCWYLALDESRKSLNCEACEPARVRACSLGLVVACSLAGSTPEARLAAWRTGISIALGTCDRDRGLNMLCTRALAEMTSIPLAASLEERNRSGRARAILAQRLSAPLNSRCPTSIDACLGYALLEFRRSSVADRDKANGQVKSLIGTLARGCDDRKPSYCLGLAFLVGGRQGNSDEIGLEAAFGDYRDEERARHAALRACGLARARDGDQKWPQECDLILNRMKLDEIIEALTADEYTR